MSIFIEMDFENYLQFTNYLKFEQNSAITEPAQSPCTIKVLNGLSCALEALNSCKKFSSNSSGHSEGYETTCVKTIFNRRGFRIVWYASSEVSVKNVPVVFLCLFFFNSGRKEHGISASRGGGTYTHSNRNET